jgi:DNA-binding LacI/PurR family transcriptional regulator
VDRGDAGQPDRRRESGEALLTRYPQITAAVCYQDIVALGVMQALRKTGREPGVILRWWDLTILPKPRWFSRR